MLCGNVSAKNAAADGVYARKFTFGTSGVTDVDEVEVSTVVYVPPEEVYEFLLDFPGYARYSEYLDRVVQDGDGSPGTNYDLVFSWWKLSYTARSEVTDVSPPTRIDWRIVKDIDAEGYWAVEPDPDDVLADEQTASRVRFHVAFDPGSASDSAIDLPRLVSMDWVIEKVKPLIRKEATKIVERVVEVLEGQERDVDLEIHAGPDSV